MKKWLSQLIFLLAGSTLVALPIGNPAEPTLLGEGLFLPGNAGLDVCDLFYAPRISWCDSFSLRFGFYGDYVFNHHMELKSGQDVEKTEIYTNAGYLVFNLLNRIDIFGTLGASNLFVRGNSAIFRTETTTAPFEMESTTDFSWSIGSRVTFIDCGCLFFGAEGQYFRIRTDLDRVTTGISEYYDDVHMDYWEWQIGVSAGVKTGVLLPYLGLKISQSRLDFNEDQINVGTLVFNLNEFHQKQFWGYACGVSLIDIPYMSATAEARFGDEKALHVKTQCRF